MFVDVLNFEQHCIFLIIEISMENNWNILNNMLYYSLGRSGAKESQKQKSH